MDIGPKVKYPHFLERGSIWCGRSTECCSLRDSWSWYREFCCTTNRRYGTIYVSRSTRIGKKNQVLPWSSCIPSTIGGAAESIERNVVGTVLFSFDTGTTDSEVRKVDSSISVDRDDVAFNAFVKQTEDVARTILFDITNSAETVLNTLKVYDGTGSTALSGAYSELKFTAAHVGLGGLAKHGVAVKKQVFGYVGEGSLNTLTGFSRKFRERIYYRNDPLLRDWFCNNQSRERLYLCQRRNIPTNRSSNRNQICSSLSCFWNNHYFWRTHSSRNSIHSRSHSLVDYQQYLEANVANVIVPFASGRFFGIGSGDEAYARNTYVGIGSMSITDEGSTINDPFRIPRTFTIIV